tara:strand:- start:237 stop:815 length:579 start_codon:yes stop_codon:yes gene_type:complete
MNQSLQDMEAKGLSDAFTQAQSQFQRDRDARFKGLTSADAGQLALAKQRSGEQIATEEAKRQAAAQNLQAQIAQQKAFEAAMGRGLKGSQILSGLTKAEQDLDMQRLKALSDVGSQRQAMMQRAYDTQYEDFLAQREYPYQQLEKFSSILQGMPTRPDISERMYRPQANPMSQMLQTGLGAYGAYRGLGGGS